MTSAETRGGEPRGLLQDRRLRERIVTELFRTQARSIERFMRRRGHSAEDARDLTQDVFYELSRCDLQQLAARPRPLTFRIARIVSMLAYRVRSQKSAPPLHMDSIDDHEIGDWQPTQEQRMIWRDQVRFVLETLEAQPVSQRGRQAFILYHFHDYSRQEIAELQGNSLKSVEHLIRRCAPCFTQAVRDNGVLAA